MDWQLSKNWRRAILSMNASPPMSFSTAPILHTCEKDTVSAYVNKQSLVTLTAKRWGELPKGKFTRMTQINCVISRMTHIFQKLLEYFLVEIALIHSYNKKKILPKYPYHLVVGRFIFKKINLSSNKSVYKICLEK